MTRRAGRISLYLLCPSVFCLLTESWSRVQKQVIEKQRKVRKLGTYHSALLVEWEIEEKEIEIENVVGTFQYLTLIVLVYLRCSLVNSRLYSFVLIFKVSLEIFNYIRKDIWVECQDDRNRIAIISDFCKSQQICFNRKRLQSVWWRQIQTILLDNSVFSSCLCRSSLFFFTPLLPFPF